MRLSIPAPVWKLLETLNRYGFEAYAVGGCVRDSILGKVPHDWDITTNALPEEIKRCFSGLPVLETGIRHGTVTVLAEHTPYEITTYRVDGDYLDCRHPQQVTFTRSLREDLARRDFTMNALAYHPQTGLQDFFGGMEDIRHKRICCVGNPELRFQEDALRIMRAMRFASVLGFSIEERTADALHRSRTLLQHIAAERLAAELKQLLLGASVREVLHDYVDTLGVVIPEVLPMVGFDQHNPHHNRTIWEHTIESIAQSPKNLLVRLTMLLHDIGKPLCYTQDAQGIGHFYEHAKHSTALARTILARLKFDTQTIDTVTLLVQNHSIDLSPNPRPIKRLLHRLGAERFALLLEVKRADTLAQAPQIQQIRLENLAKVQALMEEILREQACFSLQDLAVNGRDLMELGIPQGKQIGLLLNTLLEWVMDHPEDNNKGTLLRLAEQQAHEYTMETYKSKCQKP